MAGKAALDRLLEVARAELALPSSQEQPRGSNNVKYNTAFYGRPVSGKAYKWCVVFQWWCFQKAGLPMSVFPKSARVFAVRDWFKARDRFFPTPQVGDLVIFSRSHIGLVEKLLTEGRIQTIEGNSDHRVRRCVYRIGDPGIDGYCRPQYGAGRELTRYTVVSGDVLSRIAQRFDTSVDAIMRVNKGTITHPDRIRVGQVINIPADGR